MQVEVAGNAENFADAEVGQPLGNVTTDRGFHLRCRFAGALYYRKGAKYGHRLPPLGASASDHGRLTEGSELFDIDGGFHCHLQNFEFKFEHNRYMQS